MRTLAGVSSLIQAPFRPAPDKKCAPYFAQNIPLDLQGSAFAIIANALVKAAA